MQFVITKEALLTPLQLVSGVVDNRQDMPILANVLLTIDGDKLSLVGTDIETEITSRSALNESYDLFEVTVPAKKLLDICRASNDKSDIRFTHKDNRFVIQSGKSRFSISTLPAVNFPQLEEGPAQVEFSLLQGGLKRIIENVSFSVAQEDIRYYLNGVLLEIKDNKIVAVATDGHRLSMSALPSEAEAPSLPEGLSYQVIIPRKGVMELMRLLNSPEETVGVAIGEKQLKLHTNTVTFLTKLVDSRYPDYTAVIPKQCDNIVSIDRERFRQAITRSIILFSEKVRGIRLQFSNGLLRLKTTNQDQEEASDEIEIDYDGQDFDLSYNASYLLDVLSAIKSKSVEFCFNNAQSSALIREAADANSLYVVMPMKL